MSRLPRAITDIAEGRYRSGQYEPADTIDIEINLRGDLAAAVTAEAHRRGVRAVDLMADLVEAAIRDDLFAAILDD